MNLPNWITAKKNKNPQVSTCTGDLSSEPCPLLEGLPYSNPHVWTDPGGSKNAEPGSHRPPSEARHKGFLGVPTRRPCCLEVWMPPQDFILGVQSGIMSEGVCTVLPARGSVALL